MKVELPEICYHQKLFNCMNTNNCFNYDWEEIDFIVPSNFFISAASLSYLACWGKNQVKEGKILNFKGDRNQLDYLSRMDLFNTLNFRYKESFRRYESKGRFLPVHKIDNSQDVFNCTNEICELIISSFENPEKILFAVEWTINELIDNIQVHSNTLVPGIVCAQTFVKQNRLDIGIYDLGIGIKSSMRSVLGKDITHKAAITEAIKKGVTRDKSVGLGNGLAGSIEIVKQNKGRLNLWSGDTNYLINYGTDRGFYEIPFVDGTGLFLSFFTNKTINLQNTFIGESDFNYIDAFEEKIHSEGSIIVKNECSNFGSRNSAKLLRKKIELVLPKHENFLYIDFKDITMASSSFLDELIGKLTESLSIDEFNNKIKIINCSELIIKMINVVVNQRKK